ncbi:MAG: ABC transporter substrate-binding protein [Nannocystales bacterium]
MNSARRAQRSSSFSGGAALVFITVVGLGCSLTLDEPVPCRTDAECRESFTFGASCGADGLCMEPLFPDRCGRSFPSDALSDPEAYRESILIGSLFSFEDHSDTLQAAELAVRQANAQGGLEGREFVMIHCDYTPGAGDSLDDIEAVEELTPYLSDVLGAQAIVGPRGSSRTLAAYASMGEMPTVIISPSATSPLLTSAEAVTPSDETPGLLWRTAPPDTLQGAVIAQDMLERGVQTVAVLYQAGAYGEGLSSLFSSTLSAEGGSVSLLAFGSGEDFSLEVALIAEGIEEGDFDEVLMISSEISDYITFFDSASATGSLRRAYGETLGSESDGIFLPDAAFSGQLLTETTTQAQALFGKVRGSRPAPADGVVFNTFSASYRSEFNEDSTGSAFTPHSYDAAWMVLYGLAWASYNEDTVDGLGIARGLRQLSSGAPVDVLASSWSTIQASFQAGRSVDLRGASGALDYDPQTEETRSPIEVWSIESEDDAYSFMRERVVEL